MPRFMRLIAPLFVVLSALPAALSAQGAIPEFRYLASPDTDFYGSDLEPLFDTDLPSCIRTCSADASCGAFTYNTRTRACFPKSAVSDRVPYEGAFSARKIATDRAVLRAGAERAADLTFLGEGDLAGAAALARDLGLRHPPDASDPATLLEAARAQAARGEARLAANWTAAAVALLSDRSGPWAEYARRLLTIEAREIARRNTDRRNAVAAATNAYLRAATGDDRAEALVVLARALERVGRGRDMIGALRLAQAIRPDADIDVMLDDAIGKYGFRIVESTVESDSATPRICAEFSGRLDKAVDYEPFLRLPAPGLMVEAQGRQLCVGGVEHGVRYRLTFRAGLPAADGEALSKDVEITHYVRDRAPIVRFPGRSYVLPRTAEAALPVLTVNTDRIDLRLRRVSDRNLIRAFQDSWFGRPLSRWQEDRFGREIGEDIWTGSAEIAGELNREVTTRLPLTDAIAGQPPGIYALSARVPGTDPWDVASATQWFVLSDLGLSTMSGTDGLHVLVHGLSDAAPREGISLSLISRANAVLATARTDTEGHAVFGPGLTRGTGGAAPALIVARQGEEDIAFLSLTEPAFDLSDRGVAGRPAPGLVDVFLTTDRGAYRAGETIYATALARDDTAAAIEGLPLIAVLSRPDGVEYARRISGAGNAGGHVFDFALGSDVPRGTWRLDIRADPEAEALASRRILVEDFLPEQIDFDLALPAGPIRLGDRPLLRIDARYLFGAPGADLKVEGEVRIRAADRVEAWPGFRFGRHDAPVAQVSEQFGGLRTDAQGRAVVPLVLPEPETGDQPLEATVIARLADGSARPVERGLTAPVRPAGPVIGIRPLFDDIVPEGGEAAFEVIGLAPTLAPMPMRVKWTLNRVETRYQWYQLYGNWEWEPVTRRTRVATGETALDATPLRLSLPVDWGSYELVVERTDGDFAAASIAFDAGWYGAADAAATPDRLEMSLDRESYRPGDTALLRIVPRAGGTALITVMSNRVIARRAVAVKAGESVIPLPVTAEWGAGAYVVATVIRPLDGQARRNPGRALGVVHASVAPEGRVLDVAIDAPEVVRPRRAQTVRVTVGGARRGEPVWLTLAAVDLGILNLTGFESPDPKGHYFGQRRLGVELRDLYGRLIDGMNGAMGVVRSGGDGAGGMRMQSPPPTQDLVALFSGPVRVGEDGSALIDIELPDFNGTVRLMTVAWSRSSVGQAARDMTVRDPVVVTASLPRFLAPGDRSRILLRVAHADGPAGEMRLDLGLRGEGLRLGAGPGGFRLEPGGRREFAVPVTALAPGDSEIALSLTLPDGRVLRQALRLTVRSNDPVVSETRRFSLAAGDGFLFTDDVFAGYRPGTGQAILSAGPLAKFDVPGLLARLDRYPYGCTEQLTSKALPLLYLSSVAQAGGLGSGAAIRRRINATISRILTRQAANGAFGLWRPDSGDPWLDAYVSDFLARARAAGHAVPDLPFRQAMDNLRNSVNRAADFDRGGEAIAYALMVLAREGAAAMADLRYYADAKGDAFATPLAAAQLGAALAMYGDRTRADAMFRRAAKMLQRQDEGRESPRWRADYGTALRDAAGVLALAAEAGSETVDLDALALRVGQGQGRRSTQESAWTLLAANALVSEPERAGLRVNGQAVSGPFVRVRADDGRAGEMTITTAGGRATDITLTTLGVPRIPPPAGGAGYRITRSYYAMDGTPLDGTTFAVGDRFVTVIEVNSLEREGARLMVDDPLPAGIEIDNPNLLRSGDVAALGWLAPGEAAHAEFRTDRFLAAVDLRAGVGEVTLAYVARAVSPGKFHRPAALVEDMYRPRLRAWTGTGSVTVGE